MITASYGHYGQRAARIGPDRICRIRLPASVSALFFQRRHGSYFTKPTRIRCGWPGQGLEASWCAGIIGPGFWQDAPGPLPVSDFFTRFRSFTDDPDNIVQNQPGSDLVLADCQTDPVRKHAGLHESTGPFLANASHLIRTGCESDPACLLGQFCSAYPTA